MFKKIIYCFSGLFQANTARHQGWQRDLFSDDLPWSASSGDYLFSRCWKTENRAFWSELGDKP